MEWISIKDRTPENKEWVLVCTNLHDIFHAQYFTGYLSDSFEVQSTKYEKGRNIITHWIYEKDFPFPDKDK